MRYRIETEPLAVLVGGHRLLVHVRTKRIDAMTGGVVRAWLWRSSLAGYDVDVIWTAGGTSRIRREADRDAIDDALRAVARQHDAVDTLAIDDQHTYHLGHIGQHVVAWAGHIPVARQQRGRDVEWMPPPAEVPEAARGILADRLGQLVMV